VLRTEPQDGFIGGFERAAAPMARSIEEYFAIFKRGMKRIHQHCEAKHLHRYLTEFDSRDNRRTATTTSKPAEEQSRSKASAYPSTAL
jgi:hypothetical protein